MTRIYLHAPISTLHCGDYVQILLHNLPVDDLVIDTCDYPRWSAYIHLTHQAANANCSIILSLIGEKLLSYTLLYSGIASIFSASPKIYIFYFLHHNLSCISFKSFFLSLLLLASPIKKILTSDARLLFRPSIPQRLLRERLSFVCDPCYLVSPSSPSRESFWTSWGVSHEQCIISCVGMLNEKKFIHKLIPSLYEIRFRIPSSVVFVLAGIMPASLLSLHAKTIKELSCRGVLVFREGYQDDPTLSSIISYSDAIWCVQNMFDGSSGIFSKACLAGRPSIVAEGSYLASIVNCFGLGFTISPPNMVVCLEALCSLIARRMGDRVDMASERCRAYASLNSPEFFSSQLLKAIR